MATSDDTALVMVERDTVLWTAVPLGSLILVTYGWMVGDWWSTRRDYKGTLLAHSQPFAYWTISAVVTAASWGWLFIYWLLVASRDHTTVFGYSLDTFYGHLIYPLTVFLASALTWAPLTIWSARNAGSWLPRRLVTASLLTTALSSCVLFAMAVGTRDATPPNTWSWNEVTLALAGGMVAAHHVIWDLCVWDSTWGFYDRA